MARDAWWTGTRQAGLDRAVEMGGLPPPGSLPKEMENEYRMAPNAPDPLDFDYAEKMAAQPTRADVVGAWQQQAQALAEARPQEGRSGIRQPRKRRRGASMRDAGNALASWEQDENTRLMRQSGVI